MGTRAREKPERLAEKLVQVRIGLGLSQNEMIRRLEAEEVLTQSIISNFELGKREPSLLLLLKYAHVAGVHVEDLIDDNLDLPANLPGSVQYKGIRSRHAAKNRKRW